MLKLEDLDVFKLSEELSDKIWFAFDNWSKKTQITIGYQLIRSCDSISANIAEGYGRYTPADRRKFYLYSRGSFKETETWINKLIRRKEIGELEFKAYKTILDVLGPKLNAFIHTTK